MKLTSCLLIALGCGISTLTAGELIELKPEQVFDVTGLAEGTANALVDEPESIGNPAAEDGGTPSNRWFPGWGKWHYPHHAIIDLGGTYQIDAVYFYHGGSQYDLEIDAGEPGHWTSLFNEKTSGGARWMATQGLESAKFLRVTVQNGAANVVEIAAYGTLLKASESKAQGTPSDPKTMDQLIGLCGFIDDPRDLLQVGGFLREYHNWPWDEPDNNLDSPKANLGWNPSPSGGANAWNFDDYYRDLKERGVFVAPVLSQTVQWLNPDMNRYADYKPLREGDDPEDPASYKEHSRYFFQFAARYGATKVAPDRLQLMDNQKPLSGLGYLTHYENWNEQDKNWKGRKGYFSPYEYAAMSSADYDGHMGSLGPDYGIVNADPEAKLVMGGLSELDLDYIRGLMLWCDYHRDGNFPWAALNFHHYSNDGTSQRVSTTGVSPEADGLHERMEEIVEFRNRYLPGVEVWITEFGYDTNPDSPQCAPAVGPYSNEQVQGQWLVRSYLAIAAAHVDRAAMFMLRDGTQGPGRFMSSGLTGPKNDWTQKPAWFYVNTLRDALSGMVFSKEIPAEHDDVSIYTFRKPDNSAGAIVLWCPTSDGTVVPAYSLKIPDGYSAELVTLTDGEPQGLRKPLELSDQGTAKIDVSEKPCIVVLKQN